MSRAPRRPSTYSRNGSSNGHRALSVTEAVQNIRLTDTVGEYPAGPPISSYSPSDRRQRSPYRDTYTAYGQSPREASPYSSTLDPSVLHPRSTASQAAYSEHSDSTAISYLTASGNMRHVAHPSLSDLEIIFADNIPNSYSPYSQPPLSSPYRQDLTRSSSTYGKLTSLVTSDPPSRRRLNEVDYTNPSTQASMSRSMSGPSLPSMPPKTYEEVRNVGREFVERRRRTLHRPRRERKILFRQAVLPSTLRSSQAEDVSGSIDSFLAHSTSTYEPIAPYTTSATHGTYLNPSTR